MKTTYVIPQTEVMKMVSERLLANSPDVPFQEGEPDVPAMGREDDVSPSNPNVWDQKW